MGLMHFLVRMSQPIKDLQNYETKQLKQLLECISLDYLRQDISKITLFVLINNLVINSGVSLNTLSELKKIQNSKITLHLPSANFNTQYYNGSVNWCILQMLENITECATIIITLTKSLSFATLLYNAHRSLKCIKMAFFTTSISFEATNVFICAFTQLVNEVKQHQGQIKVAQESYNLLTVDDEESDLNLSLKELHITYFFGAALDQIKFIINRNQSQDIGQRAYEFELENNKKTFKDTVEIGNIKELKLFLSYFIIYKEQNNNETELLLIDYLAIAVSEIGAITERRIQRLMNAKLTKLQECYEEYLKDEESPFGFQQLANQASNLKQKKNKYFHPFSGDSMPQTTHLEDQQQL
ncbi:unnamed protein product (macronuclear) [Paramecium tetraurelia]|uniref:Uncharacterized protein n=1 Tax=Paramecium tetraurelia TaxID=5888 RepID=A0CF92_PARTE|nr:uncharacterized protein GSPATT00037898001 [Paramecium tetraurelia]CAK69459.1 unnamed protein product [Paramecium tetraurelia]|eukprot:XP_001436856.1 hypothetical protein (macronuclear) [Paramecium tetraurelia strain d4-2]